MKKLKELEKILKYTFKNPELLLEALTHPSYSNEHHLGTQYQRLELLGDSFLSLIVTKSLIDRYNNYREGQITDLRKKIVCQKALANKARGLNLGDFVLLGKGEAAGGGANRDKLLCDLMESVTGALYADGGYDATKEFVERVILNDEQTGFVDYKSELQELLGQESDHLEYVLLSDEGPDHDKTYIVAAMLYGDEIGIGSGSSKKAAEFMAAAQGIERVKQGKLKCIV